MTEGKPDKRNWAKRYTKNLSYCLVFTQAHRILHRYRDQKGSGQVVETCYARSRGGGRWASGFTLIEVLVALAVLSVAASVFISLFSNCVALGQRDRSRQVAYSIAQQRLTEIAVAPESYAWPASESLASGELMEVAAPAETTAISSQTPVALPTYPAADRRERSFHERFSSQLYARGLGDGSGMGEVTAVVRWQSEGRDQSVSLTTLMPIPATGGNS